MITDPDRLYQILSSERFLSMQGLSGEEAVFIQTYKVADEDRVSATVKSLDYIAEILKHQRTEDFTSAYKEHFEIVSEVSTRDQTGFEKTFSRLMKIIHPDGKATAEEIAELLQFGMECRRRVREHILRLDDTFKRHDSPNFHARNITTDTGCKITMDRGLDIFQKFETGPFSLEQAVQEARLTRGVEVTYLKV